MSEEEEILGAFLLVNDYRILTNEELEDVKKAINNLQQENVKLKQQLKDKDEKISELNNLVDMSGKFTGSFFDIGFKQNQKLEKIKAYLETTYTEWFNWKSDILEILERNKED